MEEKQMINNVTLVGRLTKDVELRFTPAGKAVASGTLAVNRTFTNQNGEREADFINFVIWGKGGENTANFTKKGSLIGLTGRIQTRNYENSEGKRVFVAEVVAESVQFLEPKGNGSQQQSKPNAVPSVQSNDPFNGSQIDITDDSLPF